MRVAPPAQEGAKQDGEKRKREQKSKDATARRKFTKEERSALIKKARIWLPTNIPEMNLKLGPQDAGAFQPGEEVLCEYVPVEDPPGTTRKFNCAISKGDVVKVRRRRSRISSASALPRLPRCSLEGTEGSLWRTAL